MTRKYDLSGPTGNAHALIAIAQDWGRQLDWDRMTIAQMTGNLTRGDYNHLLNVFDETFGDIVDYEFLNDPRKGKQCWNCNEYHDPMLADCPECGCSADDGL